MHPVKPKHKARTRSVALAASLWHITAQLDRETSEETGADGTFRVVKLEDDEETISHHGWTKARTFMTSKR